MLDERILWTLIPAVIALVVYILFRNHKWYGNDSMPFTAFVFAVASQAIGPRLFHFDSNVPVVMLSALGTILVMGSVTLLKAKRKGREANESN